MSDILVFFIKFIMFIFFNILRSFNNLSYDDIRFEMFDIGFFIKEIICFFILNVMCLFYDDCVFYFYDLFN